MLEGLINIVSVHFQIYIIDGKVPSPSLNLFNIIFVYVLNFFLEILTCWSVSSLSSVSALHKKPLNS